MRLFYLVITLFCTADVNAALYDIELTLYPSGKKTTYKLKENSDQQLDVGIKGLKCQAFRDDESIGAPKVSNSQTVAMVACSDEETKRDWEMPIICVGSHRGDASLMLNNKKDKKGFKITGKCPWEDKQ